MNEFALIAKVVLAGLELMEARGVRIEQIASLKAVKGKITVEDLEAIERATEQARQRAQSI